MGFLKPISTALQQHAGPEDNYVRKMFLAYWDFWPLTKTA